MINDHIRTPSRRAATLLVVVLTATLTVAQVSVEPHINVADKGEQGRRRAPAPAALSGYEAPPATPHAVPGDDAGGCTGSAWPSNLVHAEMLVGLPSVPGCGRSVSADVGRNLYLHSGEVYEESVDLRIPGVGIDVVWARKYRSRLGPDTAMGKGWDFSYNVWVERSGDDVVVHDGNTRADVYRLQGNGGTYACREQFNVGTFPTPNEFTLTFPDGGIWEFAPLDGSATAGKLLALTDRNGNAITLSYDVAGRLDTITDTLGRIVTVTYGADGYIDAVTDFSGRQVVYDHYGVGDPGGSPGDLASTTTPVVTGTSTNNDFPSGKTTTYTYSKGAADERLNHNLLTVTDPKGQAFLANAYDPTTDPAAPGFDRLARQTWGHPGDVIDLTYRRPGPTSFGAETPSIDGPVATPAALTVWVNDRVGHVEAFSYDAFNRLVEARELTGTADPDMPSFPGSNMPGAPLRAGDPDAFVTRFAWNGESLLVRVVHPRGNVTRYVYEIDMDGAAVRRSAANLRKWIRERGDHPGASDQTRLVDEFEYDTGGGCCGSNHWNRHFDHEGYETEITHDARGNVIRIEHPYIGMTEDFSYDARGRLVQHIQPSGCDGERRVDDYEYYGPADGAQNGYLKSEIIDATNLALTTTWVYDSVGHVVRYFEPNGDGAILEVNALGQVVRRDGPAVAPGAGPRYHQLFHYDANDNVVQLDVLNMNEYGVVDPVNDYLTTLMAYDVLDRLDMETREISTADVQIVEYEYDANGNETRVLSPETKCGVPGSLVETQYDERGLVYRVAAGDGHVNPGNPYHLTQTDHDANGNVVRVTVGSLDGSAARSDHYDYDAFDRVVTATDAMGNETRSVYDGRSLVVQTSVWGEVVDLPGGTGNVLMSQVDMTYDAQGRLRRTDTQWFDPTTGAALGPAVASIIDVCNNGLIEALEDDNGRTHQVAYDSAYRKSGETDAAGNTVAFGRDGNGNVLTRTVTEMSDASGLASPVTTTYHYDGLGRIICKEDEDGHVWTWLWDSRGNLKRKEDGRRTDQGADPCDEDGNVVLYEYDGLDRLVRTTYELTATGDGGGTPSGTSVVEQTWGCGDQVEERLDPSGNVTGYEYDELGRLVKTIYADLSESSIEYGLFGEPSRTVDAAGTIVDFTYDDLGRVASKTITPGTGVSSDTTFETFSYDALHRVVRAQDDDSLVQRCYDSLGRLLEEDLDGRVVSVTTDGVGNVVELAYPGGRNVVFTHDELNRRESATDASGLLFTRGFVGDRVERITRANGTETTLSHNGRGLPTTISTLMGATPMDSWTMTWDGNGNMASRSSVLPPAGTWDYGYSSLARLIVGTWTPSGGSPAATVYHYDGAGNRTTVTGGADGGTYAMTGVDADLNQYTSTPFWSALYDAVGNVTELDVATPAPTVRTMTWDYRNRLVSHANSATGTTTSYDYDAFGRRIVKTVTTGVSTETTRYSLLDHDVLEEQDDVGATVATYVWGDEHHELLHMERKAGASLQSYFPISGLGLTVTSLQDDTGAVVERYDYSDFGAPTFMDASGAPLGASTVGNPYLFDGYRWDGETGFFHLQTRDYAPRWGRFVSRDTIGIWGDEDNLGNGAAYVANNPWTLSDPTGEAQTPKFKGSCKDDPELQAIIEKQLGKAEGRLNAANNHMQALTTKAEQKADALFGRWFGDYKKTRFKKVRKHFEKALKYARDKRITFKCRDELKGRCKITTDGTKIEFTVAYVTAFDSKKKIYLCPTFFTMLSSAQQAFTILHELAHEAGARKDKAYSHSESLQLADKHPGKAVDNGANHEWFANEL